MELGDVSETTRGSSELTQRALDHNWQETARKLHRNNSVDKEMGRLWQEKKQRYTFLTICIQWNNEMKHVKIMEAWKMPQKDDSYNISWLQSYNYEKEDCT